MEQKRKLLWELGLCIFLVFWFFFIASNVDFQLGNLYGILALGALIIALVDYQFAKREIQLMNPNNSWIAALGIAVVGYFVIMFGGQLVVKLLSGVPITNVLKLLEASSPIFSNSLILNKITFGIMVAYLETYAIFVVGYDLLASMFNVQINTKNLKNPKLIGIIIGLTLFFLILHATAKSLDQASLVIVGFMGLVSLIIVTITKEGRSAILTHIIANSFAVFI